MAVKFNQLSLRDLFAVILPAVLIAGLAFWAAAQFIKPAPPGTMTISTGGEGGAYQRFAVRYHEIFARHGVELIAVPSAGSIENVARLRDPAANIDAAFVQGGTARIRDGDDLHALGAFYYEPLWIFYRSGLQPRAAKAGDADLDSLTTIMQLKGRRIAADVVNQLAFLRGDLAPGKRRIEELRALPLHNFSRRPHRARRDRRMGHHDVVRLERSLDLLD